MSICRHLLPLPGFAERTAGRVANAVPERHRQRGITLIELMVGLVIGLVAVLVISQVMLAAEAHKRTTTSGSDAQLTGTLALYTLQRDLQMAGYGIAASQLGLGCKVQASLFNNGNGGGIAERLMAPVQIYPSATVGAPDRLRIIGSTIDRFSVPTLVTSDHPKAGAVGVTEFVVNTIVGIQAGDLMIAVPPAPSAADTCTMFLASGVASAPARVFHAAGAGDPLGWNGSGTGASQTLLQNYFPAAGYPAGSYLVNLGSGLVDRTYSVASGSLRMTEFNNSAAPSTQTELFPQVVNMRALYGKDTTLAADGSVDRYDNDTPTTPDGWSRVITIRVALVVRSGQYEKDIVTPSEPMWDLGSATEILSTLPGLKDCPSGSGKCIDLKVNGDINDNDWQHYRYKIYDTIIPVRNVVWRS